MAAENNFTIDFPKCHTCGETETIARKAVAEYIESGEMPQETFASVEKMIIPLKDPRQAALTVPTLMIHWDVCAKCGTRYCTRAQKFDAPIKFVGQGMPGMNPPGQFGGLFGKG